MLDEQDRCLHLFTHTTRRPMGRRRHGGQYVERVRCNDCEATVMVRTFDDPRDDLDRFLPPDGPATTKDGKDTR